jgi:hypothetical protein
MLSGPGKSFAMDIHKSTNCRVGDDQVVVFYYKGRLAGIVAMVARPAVSASTSTFLML